VTLTSIVVQWMTVDEIADAESTLANDTSELMAKFQRGLLEWPPALVITGGEPTSAEHRAAAKYAIWLPAHCNAD
jgi:hypothetical protein